MKLKPFYTQETRMPFPSPALPREGRDPPLRRMATALADGVELATMGHPGRARRHVVGPEPRPHVSVAVGNLLRLEEDFAGEPEERFADVVTRPGGRPNDPHISRGKDRFDVFLRDPNLRGQIGLVAQRKDGDSP